MTAPNELPEDIAWLHKFINCVPFGEHAPRSDIERAHQIVERQQTELELERHQRAEDEAHYKADVERQQGRIGELSGALEKYGAHSPACAFMSNSEKCICGLDAARSEGEK